MNAKTVRFLKPTAISAFQMMLPPNWLELVRDGKKINLPASAIGSRYPTTHKTIMRRIKREYLALNHIQRGLLKSRGGLSINN